LNNKRTEITAFILSGGKSSRIGKDKALLSIEGKPLIQKLIELLEPIFSEVVISSNQPELFNFTEKKVIKDSIPDRGPLSGIHSVLKFSDTEKNFIISCDMPFVSVELIDYLCEYKSNKPIVLPKAEGRVHQLCGLYSKSILADVEKLLFESRTSPNKIKGSIFELRDRVPSEIVEVSKLEFYYKDIFFNMNTLDDYEYVKNKFASK